MFCKACGNQMDDGAAFCPICGAPSATPDEAPTAPAEAALPSTPRTSAPGQPSMPLPPPKKRRLGLWLSIAGAAVVLIAAGLALWFFVFDEGDDVVETTTTTMTTVAQSTSTTASSSTTTSPASSTTSSSSSTTLAAGGDPGDSQGEWVELDNSALPSSVVAAAVSDEALLLDARVGDGYALYAYLFDSKELIELPIEAGEFFDADIDGLMAVWWEGDYDETTGTYANERIYSYALPDGPKVEVVGGDGSPGYPQISGRWVTWTEGGPWEENPEETWRITILGVQVNARGEPEGDPAELVPAAIAYVIGDATWTYSLSDGRLAWENLDTVESSESGLYVMDLGSFQPQLVNGEAWHPALAGDSLVYRGDGLEVMNLETGSVQQIDTDGDFPAAGPTFAVYYRNSQSAGEGGYEIVTRGLSGGHEQVLGKHSYPPWLSPYLAASANHIAIITDDEVHVFEWQGAHTQ